MADEEVKKIALKDYKGHALYDEQLGEFVYPQDQDVTDFDWTHTYYACDERTNWVALDAKAILDDLRSRAEEQVDEGFEMVHYDTTGLIALQRLLDEWSKKHLEVAPAYFPDKKTQVVVTKEDCGFADDEEVTA